MLVPASHVKMHFPLLACCACLLTLLSIPYLLAPEIIFFPVKSATSTLCNAKYLNAFLSHAVISISVEPGDTRRFQLPFPSLLTHFSDELSEKRHSLADSCADLSGVKLCVHYFRLYWLLTCMFPVSRFVADPAGAREVISSRLLPLRGLQRMSGRHAVHCGLRKQNLLCQRLPQVSTTETVEVLQSTSLRFSFSAS